MSGYKFIGLTDSLTPPPNKRSRAPTQTPAVPPADRVGAGVYSMRIDGWHPLKVNRMTGHHWKSYWHLKENDQKLVADHRFINQIPAATTKRRVELTIVMGPRQRGGDPDCYWKSLLDALTACGLLVDDSRQWCETPPAVFERGPIAATIITLSDI